MPRIKGGHASKERRRKILKDAKGYWGTRSKNIRLAKQFVLKAHKYAFRDRRTKKRNFRSLWIIRISAACMQRGISYSRFMGGLKMANIDLNRKMLSEIAIFDAPAFDALVNMARSALPRTAAVA